VRRFLSTILAVLVVVLSCFPCNDSEAAPLVESRLELTAAASDGCHGHQMDLCSPFCTCSCCSGIAIPAQAVLQFPVIAAFSEVPPDGFRTHDPVPVYLPIWQPPKLG
jgi:hypothetical protein